MSTETDHEVTTEPPRSWQPVDLAPVLDGTYRPPVPSVGARDDGVGLLYPGCVHTVSSEAEAGKTWFALHAAAQVLAGGAGVLYLDFEDDAAGVVGRLLELGADPETVAVRFGYIRPNAPLQQLVNQGDLTDAMLDYRPALIVVDGVTEAMSLHGLELKSNMDVARFNTMLPRTLAASGAAVVLLDHVVKDREGRGRYSLGGVHKLNAVDGAAYTLENRTPFGEGITGRSSVLLAKDRPGQLRKHAVRTTVGAYWFADLVLDSELLAGIPDLTVRVQPPEPCSDQPFRPTTLMQRVSEAMERAGEPLTARGILDRVRGRAVDVRAAIAVLVDEHYIRVRTGPRNAQWHELVTPFGGPHDRP